MKRTLATFTAALAFLIASCATFEDYGESIAPAIGEATEQAIAEWLASQESQPPATTNAPPPVIVTPPPAVTNAPPVVVPPVAPPVEPPATASGKITTANATATARAWYPGVKVYEDQGEWGISKEALFKPIGDGGRPAVVIIPAFEYGKILSVSFGGETLTKADGVANGWRTNWRLRKQGGSYPPGPLTVRTNRGTMTAQIAKPGSRTILKLPAPK